MARTRATDSWTKERGVGDGNVRLALYKWEKMTGCGEAVEVRSDRDLLDLPLFIADTEQAPNELGNKRNTFRCISVASKIECTFS